MTVRRVLLLLPLLTVACAAQPPAGPTPAARFATAVQQADDTAEKVFDHMEGFERRVAREQAAMGYALSVPAAAGPTRGVASAAGNVIAPGLAAIAAHAERLEAAATGDRPEIEDGAELLDDGATAGLEQLRQAGVVVPEADRRAGLAAITALARGPGGDPRRATAATLAAGANAEVRAVTGLLRRVIGDAGTGTSGALRVQRATLDASEARFLDSVRRDRRLGPAQRYALVRELAEAREGDPLLGTFDAMIAVLAAIDTAHAGIAAGGGAGEVAALEAAVARFGGYADNRGE